MPSLRELFGQHNSEKIVPISKFDNWAYDMLEALVEAVEPEDTELAGVKAEMGKLKAWASAWKSAAKHHRAGRHAAAKVLAKTMVRAGQLQETVDMYDDRPFWDDIHQLVVHKLRERLERERDEAKVVTVALHKELAEAKAEIEKLRSERDYWEKAYLVEKEAWAKIRADAEIGRLVRGMPNRTALRRFAEGTFGVAIADPNYCLSPSCWRAVSLPSTDDPAEALRAIQEVGDA